MSRTPDTPMQPLDFERLVADLWPNDYLSPFGDSLEHIDRNGGARVTSKEEPIFVFASGFRTGSTLLQRLLSSDPNVLIFGEPFEHKFLWHKLASMAKRFDGHDDDAQYLPSDKTSIEQAELNDNFIATLTPDLGWLKAAHLGFVENILKVPAAKLSRKRWGAKFVRCSSDVAQYLHWLFPQSRIVFLYRSVYDSYRSFAPIAGPTGWPLYAPNHCIRSARDFAVHWAYCARGFHAVAKSLGAFEVRYEALGDSLGALETFANVRIDRALMSVPLGSSRAGPISNEDMVVLRAIAGGVMTALGYPRA